MADYSSIPKSPTSAPAVLASHGIGGSNAVRYPGHSSYVVESPGHDPTDHFSIEKRLLGKGCFQKG